MKDIKKIYFTYLFHPFFFFFRTNLQLQLTYKYNKSLFIVTNNMKMTMNLKKPTNDQFFI